MIRRRHPGPGICAVRPFSHPRLILSEFEVAQALIEYQLAQLRRARVAVRPEIVLHPLRSFAEPLTDIENRSLLELAFSVGAWRALVHTGAELGRPEVQGLNFETAAAAMPSRSRWR